MLLLFSLYTYARSNSCPECAQISEMLSRTDPRILNWLKANVSPHTGMPLSFDIAGTEPIKIYQMTGHPSTVRGIIERNILHEGIVIYDAALWQLVWTCIGTKDALARAAIPVKYYWKSRMGYLPRRSAFRSHSSGIWRSFYLLFLKTADAAYP